MKTTFFLSFLILLASCSSNKKNGKINNAENDSLAQESYLRWGDNRLSTINPEDHLVVGCHQGKIRETLEAYKMAYPQKEKNPYYWVHIGNCYFLGKEINKAEFFYRLGLDDAKSASLKALAHNNLALTHIQFGRYSEAREHLAKAIALNKDFMVPQFNLAQIYIQFGQYDRGITLLTGPLWTKHEDVDVHFSLANAYLFKGDLTQAEAHFKQIPKESLFREDIAVTYSLFLIQKGEIEKAKKVMKDRDISSVQEASDSSSKVEKLLERRSIK